ncbi:vesicle transport protein SFT2B isoform X3 [Olea europaea var. sylvestris]|uniref:Vesicle transport protein n=2 Tax=Olea europaea subsp. europaea TaxID=158383 RepID=A0A8S0T1T3_OLEEU|nr:vesicle transport protein SFT2B isoform X3 [Olea europaea var. sylvestris]CAA2998738.1 vesicle transport SFT2B [Olea europaea subsp. europaea]
MWKLINRSASSEYEEQPEDDLLGGTEGLCSLSPLQRLYGFAACLAAGLVCVFLSLIVFVKPIKFALLFTFGNVLAIGSTTFLIGPQQQLRMMLDPVRVYATAIYAGCVVVALICALLVHSKILTIIAIICEICALVWYSLSYIPFARRVVSNLTIRLFDTEI